MKTSCFPCSHGLPLIADLILKVCVVSILRGIKESNWADNRLSKDNFVKLHWVAFDVSGNNNFHKKRDYKLVFRFSYFAHYSENPEFNNGIFTRMPTNTHIRLSKEISLAPFNSL